ncbi:hypothetical protein LINPERPRIM_LOCUS8559 [Linum perenne]
MCQQAMSHIWLESSSLVVVMIERRLPMD